MMTRLPERQVRDPDTGTLDSARIVARGSITGTSLLKMSHVHPL